MKRSKSRARSSTSSDDIVVFERLFRTHYGKLADFAFSILGSRDEAEDVVQDLFAHLWKSQTPVRLSRSYLYTAVRNRALNRLRDEHLKRAKTQAIRQQRISENTLCVSAEEIHISGELNAQVNQILSEMPERRRQIFILSRYHSFTYVEIAEVLGVSFKVVEKQMGKALASFRTRLQFLLMFLVVISGLLIF